MSATTRIAVFASGGGRSLENLAVEIAAGSLPCEIALVVSSSERALVVERARKLEIVTRVIDPHRRATADEFSREAFAAADEVGAQLVVLAGFLRLLVIPERWLGRVLNIHPALLPAFGGKGYYGLKVHEAVIAKGVQFTGCTVHYVTNEYDDGPILLQLSVPVRDDDTPETLAARVFEAEKVALPEAIRSHVTDSDRARRARSRIRRTEV